MTNPLEAQPSTRPADLPSTPGTTGSSAIETFNYIAELRPLSNSFAGESVKVAKKADANNDGTLAQDEINGALKSNLYSQSERDMLKEIKYNARQLRELSDDESFGESNVTIKDLEKFGEIEKNLKASANPELMQDSATNSYREVAKNLLDSDLLNTAGDLFGFALNNEKALAMESLDKSMDSLEGSPAAKELAKKMQSLIVSGDLESFEKSFPEWNKNPELMSSAVNLLQVNLLKNVVNLAVDYKDNQLSLYKLVPEWSGGKVTEAGNNYVLRFNDDGHASVDTANLTNRPPSTSAVWANISKLVVEDAAYKYSVMVPKKLLDQMH